MSRSFSGSVPSSRGAALSVEVAVTEQAIHVRDSKDVARPPVAVGREEWSRFVGFAAGA
ncbi:DUF397 domain-containing protein [Streptomyces sp. NPDC048581]|uniref:DUF397 domain-containing protein n=1 Tax=unclassified Streptomyces TaxID=2593676 RepID=UPI00371118EC